MYKTIKIPEMAFRNAEELKAEMEKDERVRGIRKVTLSEAVSYAIKGALEDYGRRKNLEAAIGGWADLDCDALVKDIYASRSDKTRREVAL
jgi:hypothetical protein